MGRKLVKFVDFLNILLCIVSMYVLMTDESRAWRVVAGLSVMLVVLHFSIREKVEGAEE